MSAGHSVETVGLAIGHPAGFASPARFASTTELSPPLSTPLPASTEVPGLVSWPVKVGPSVALPVPPLLVQHRAALPINVIHEGGRCLRGCALIDVAGSCKTRALGPNAFTGGPDR